MQTALDIDPTLEILDKLLKKVQESTKITECTYHDMLPKMLEAEPKVLLVEKAKQEERLFTVELALLKHTDKSHQSQKQAKTKAKHSEKVCTTPYNRIISV